MSLSKIWQRILFSRCLALNHIQSPMTHLDNLVLNSIQQPHGYQFYIAFQCFLHVFRETLPKPPRFLKSSNSNHFNRQPPPFFAVCFAACSTAELPLLHPGETAPRRLESLDHWATNSSLCSRRAEVFTKPLEIPPGGM